MEISRVTLFPCSRFAAVLACIAFLAGCSSINEVLSGDKVDYRSTSTTRASPLEVPPDLTQLSRESRYQQANGAISASTFQTATAAAAAASAPVATQVIAPQQVGAFRMERLGNERWLSTTLSPEAIYPQLRTFWKDNGFNLVQDRPEAGVLETDWAENRAKLPQDFIRSAIGRVLDSAYSTGELDKFTTRVERTATGSDVFISHRGMAEVYVGQRNDSTVWQPRPSDPQLEAAFLARLMVKLGAKEEQARTTVAAATTAAPSGPVRARLVEGQPTPTLQLDDGFDRAWRRVGIALDRSGFTVEDRDRAQGLYFVRYVDPASAGREEPNFFSRVFSRKKSDPATLAKYRVKVNSEGSSTTVAVLDSQGKPESGDAGKRIVNLLLEDLR
jgi:outer membrane protein assembly factor BamC